MHRYHQSSNSIERDSYYEWQPLLDYNYASYFDNSCNQYSHYFDAVRGHVEGDPTFQHSAVQCITCYTSLDTDLYQPAGYYKDEDNDGIIFDSGCTTTITPFTSDFEEQMTPIQKTITGLGLASEVVGKGTVRWTFKDDYGCA